MEAIPRPRIGILSFAHYHANFWAEAFVEDAEADLAGIWDEDEARGRDAASRFGTIFVPDLDDLLGRVDAVAITSVTAEHAPLAERAARAGRHILCEKPLATSMAEADRIAAAVALGGVSFMQSFPKRFDPVTHEIERAVRSRRARPHPPRPRPARPLLRPRARLSAALVRRPDARRRRSPPGRRSPRGRPPLLALRPARERHRHHLLGRARPRRRGHRARGLPMAGRARRRAGLELSVRCRRHLDRDLRHGGHTSGERRRPRLA